MPTDAPTRRRDRTAILGSIAFHLCVLTALVAVRPATFPADEPDERALIAGFIRIERAPPKPPRPVPRALPTPPPVRPRPVERPPVRVVIAHVQAKRSQVVASEPRYVAPLVHAPAPRHPRVTPARTPVPLALATQTPAPLPSATPSPAPTPGPRAVIAARDAGPGNFAESYPARPMPGMLETLRTRLNGQAVVVRVAVDDRGRATSVTIVSGIDDPALRDEVTRTLLAASYIPASCNGLGCAATVELRT